MGDIISGVGITPAGGAIGLFFAALFALLGFMLRRLGTGDAEIRTGYSGLVGNLQKSSDAYLARAERAERRFALEHGWRVRAEEYAYGLETMLGIPHRIWDHDDEDDEA